MESFFVGKRILVTGAGRGIGRGIALKLASLDAIVIALGFSENNLKSLIEENPKIQTLRANLENWKETREAVHSVLPVDLLVNNAGLFVSESFLDSKEETFDRLMNVNVKAVLNLSQGQFNCKCENIFVLGSTGSIVAQDWISRKSHGTIVNLSSVASKMAMKDHISYCASKAALDAVTRNMALELGPHGIRVNSLNPTVILTDMGKQAWSDPKKANPLLQRIPLHHFGEVEDAVNAVLFLLSNHSKFVNGTHLILDGGLLAT